MTLFKILRASCGFSVREAAEFLKANRRTAEEWDSGRRGTADGILYELSELIDAQSRMVDEMLGAIEDAPEGAFEIGFCTDDHEAQGLGLPFKSCHDAVIRRLIEALDEEGREDIILVPRASTVGTAAAEI